MEVPGMLERGLPEVRDLVHRAAHPAPSDDLPPIFFIYTISVGASAPGSGGRFRKVSHRPRCSRIVAYSPEGDIPDSGGHSLFFWRENQECPPSW